MMKDMPTVDEAENLHCPEDDEEDDAVAHAHAHAHAQERKQNHPQPRVEPTHMFLSPGQRRRKSLLAIILVLVIAVVVIIYVVVVIFRPTLTSAESPQQPRETTTTTTPNCPPPSTKSSDQQFLLTGLFQRSGCHRMECLSDHTTTLHNTNTNTNTRDRLSHNAPLCQGQALCNQDDEKFPGVLFQFGLTENGALVWQKCDPVDPSRTEIITLWEASEEHNNELPTTTNTTTAPPSSAAVDPSPQKQQLWFEMRPDATWQILSTSTGQENSTTTTTTPSSTTATATVVFEQPVQNQPRPVRVTTKCLNDRPVMDCPYIHFRRHGDIVMNYIDKQDGWVACKSDKICYASLWE